ncbi:MAG: RNA polymerase subunit sigma-70, partial [Phycisphaera sp.]
MDRLTPIVYEQLRAMATGFLAGERAGHTLQPT